MCSAAAVDRRTQTRCDRYCEGGDTFTVGAGWVVAIWIEPDQESRLRSEPRCTRVMIDYVLDIIQGFLNVIC